MIAELAAALFLVLLIVWPAAVTEWRIRCE
jgi:hypothetical protein